MKKILTILTLMVSITTLVGCKQKENISDLASNQVSLSIKEKCGTFPEFESIKTAYKADNDSLIALRCKINTPMTINGITTDDFTYVYIIGDKDTNFEVFLGGAIDLDGYAHDAIKDLNNSGKVFTGDELKRLKDNIVKMAALQAVTTGGRAVKSNP
ncbi:MAG: hypothetical protein K2N48_01565 [Muribaculaceae bacterium]|nr:hypothetical protein [Muribaculaceae bacterium]